MTSRGAPPEGMEQMGLISPLPLRPHHHRSSRRSVSLSLPVPGTSRLLSKPGSGARPLVPQPGRWCLSLLGLEQPPPFSTGSSPLAQMLPWEQRHLPVLPPRFRFFGVDLPPTCSDRLWGSKSFQSWGCLAVFLFSICNAIGPSYISCGRRGMLRGREGGQAGRCAHLASALSWGWGPCLWEAELHGWPLQGQGPQAWPRPISALWSSHFGPEAAPGCLLSL